MQRFKILLTKHFLSCAVIHKVTYLFNDCLVLFVEILPFSSITLHILRQT